MFRVVLPPIIRRTYTCIYSIWYLSHRYCYQPLSWKSWNRFECAVGGVRHPQHTQTGWSLCVGDRLVCRCRCTRCSVNAIDSPDDEHRGAQNVENWNKYKRKKNCVSSWLFTRRGKLNLYLPGQYFLKDLNEIQHRRSLHNAAKEWQVSYKQVQ
jgi:hypothetical protein